MAELLDYRVIDETDNYEVISGHIMTSGGVARFIRRAPDDAQDHYYIAGGLISGCAYHLPAEEIADSGAGSATTIRHANNSGGHDVLHLDAREIAECVEVLDTEMGAGRTHLLGHSKGTKVSALAGALLEEHIDLASVVHINPVLGTNITRRNILRKLWRLPGTSLSIARSLTQPAVLDARTQDSAGWEIRTRTQGIRAETRGLLTTESLHKRDFVAVKSRQAEVKPALVMLRGTADTLTRFDDIGEAMYDEDIKYDAELILRQPGESDHLSFINNPEVTYKMLMAERLALQSMQRIARLRNQPARSTYQLPIAGY